MEAGKKILIAGGGFGSPVPGATGAQVMLNGVALPVVSWQPTRIDATLPAEIVTEIVTAHPGASGTTVHGDLVVIGQAGPPSEPFAVELSLP